MIRATFPQTARAIDWADANSVTGHSIANTMENAAYHRSSGRKGGGGHCRGLAARMCLGSFNISRRVNFVTTPQTIPRLHELLGSVSVMQRVATGLPVKESADNSCSTLGRTASSESDSTCSLDDTVKQANDLADVFSHTTASRSPMEEHASPSTDPSANAQFVKAASNPDVGTMFADFDICDILTSGGATQTTVDICEILTSGVHGYWGPRPVEFEMDCYRASEVCH